MAESHTAKDRAHRNRIVERRSDTGLMIGMILLIALIAAIAFFLFSKENREQRRSDTIVTATQSVGDTADRALPAKD